MMIKVLICVVAVAFLQIEGRQRATSDSGNFLDDKQWLTTISQYDKEPGHWNKFRDEVEDDYFRSWNTGRHLDQGLDSTKDPCLNVKCSRHKVCIAQDNHRVVCISHRRLTHSMKETDLAHKQWKGSNCKPCPVVHPHPICGTDGHVYSSPCKLEYQACVSGKQISVKCEGRCPCTSDKSSVEGKDEKKAECSDREFREVVSRLKDWFKVLHENGNHNKKAHGLQRQGKDRVRFDTSILPICKDSLGWMFNRLDTNYDLLLDQSELGSIYFDNHDQCMKPFFNSCDTYRDGLISNNEWCFCFQRNQDPPCQMELSNIQRQQRGKKLLGIFLPTCDEDGYYKATQCHGSVGQCWCVDRYGNEMRGSRSSGSPDCGGDIEISGDFGSGDFHEWSDDEDDEEDTNDEEEDDEVDNEDDEDDDDEYDVGGYIW
ncbi:testican-3-like isoform X5 [Carcharodon carcharias]|uniref:testican-3-like isoform X5 n=1 Tax=Carcharodon carcharias TaxID=13397 RepID=UPI001B7EA931|nr:testican-3-like isoform X5 [Carcharodon carcharias]